MDRDVAMLAELPPAKWSEALRRLDVLKSFDALPDPTGKDVAEHAEQLGLTVRSFYRLIEAHEILKITGRARRSRRGKRRWLSSQLEKVILETMRDLGPEAPQRTVHLEVVRRCRAAGLEPPSENTIRTRTTGTDVDLRIRLGRRFDIVLDVCPLSLDVLDEAGEAAIATLAGVQDAITGRLLIHSLSAGAPKPEALARMVAEAAAEAFAQRALIVTGDRAQALLPYSDVLSKAGVRLDAGASHGVRAGSALMSILGLRIAKVPFAPRQSRAASPSQAVELAVAQRAISQFIQEQQYR
ncbi:hypothetical protein [Sphingomonas sp. S2-65]|uniref:hypothetical protein n=1 Tax=Sphingomonas sp. S2-65 TaxID=2903960 RepID=UPI001F205D10|nr:hypothetical protein [Sphingomonas sp. S2-65]UYY58005.1 hypothetical protein LZ586_15275 [Sphingomonas sp. S2-65]